MTQIHDLTSGDKFSLEEGGDVYTVAPEPSRVIDYWGQSLVLYYGPTGSLWGHACDHTEVWPLT